MVSVRQARAEGKCGICIYGKKGGCGYMYDGCGYVNIGAMANFNMDLKAIEEKYPKFAKAIRDCKYIVLEYYK